MYVLGNCLRKHAKERGVQLNEEERKKAISIKSLHCFIYRLENVLIDVLRFIRSFRLAPGSRQFQFS